MPVEIPSSDGQNTYVVLVNPWGDPSENICHCHGYNYKGRCRHQIEAANNVCGWTSDDPDAIEQIEDRLCPMCGGPTKYEVEML